MRVRALVWGLAGSAVLLCGCRPELAQGSNGREEMMWQQAIRESYPGNRAPQVAPPSIADRYSAKLVEQETTVTVSETETAYDPMTPAAESDPAAETENVPAERIVKAIAVLSEKAGLDGMIGGQVMDLEFENVSPEASELVEMYAKKTSCMLEASSMCGCILAGADSGHVNAAEVYAGKLGLAFQIRDDILDCIADEKIFGKPVGSDEKNGKTTFVTLYGLESAQREAERLTAEALRQLEVFGEDAEMLKELTEYLLDRKY